MIDALLALVVSATNPFADALVVQATVRDVGEDGCAKLRVERVIAGESPASPVRACGDAWDHDHREYLVVLRDSASGWRVERASPIVRANGESWVIGPQPDGAPSARVIGHGRETAHAVRAQIEQAEQLQPNDDATRGVPLREMIRWIKRAGQDSP